MKGCLRFYMEYCQIWLNIFIDYHHLSNMKKLKKKKKSAAVFTTSHAPFTLHKQLASIPK